VIGESTATTTAASSATAMNTFYSVASNQIFATATTHLPEFPDEYAVALSENR
jgi:hypothetical protein